MTSYFTKKYRSAQVRTQVFKPYIDDKTSCATAALIIFGLIILLSPIVATVDSQAGGVPILRKPENSRGNRILYENRIVIEDKKKYTKDVFIKPPSVSNTPFDEISFPR